MFWDGFYKQAVSYNWVNRAVSRAEGRISDKAMAAARKVSGKGYHMKTLHKNMEPLANARRLLIEGTERLPEFTKGVLSKMTGKEPIRSYPKDALKLVKAHITNLKSIRGK